MVSPQMEEALLTRNISVWTCELVLVDIPQSSVAADY